MNNEQLEKIATIIEYKMKEAMKTQKEYKANCEEAKTRNNSKDVDFWQDASEKALARFGAYYDALEIIKLYK